MTTKCYFLDGKLINIGEWDEQREPAHTVPAVVRQVPEHTVPALVHRVTGAVIEPARVVPAETIIVAPAYDVAERVGNPLPDGVVIEERDIVATAQGGLCLASDHAKLRKPEYPVIGDQLDALWKGGDEADAMRKKIMAIKAKYPKG